MSAGCSYPSSTATGSAAASRVTPSSISAGEIRYVLEHSGSRVLFVDAELEPLVASTYITPALLAQATVHEFFRRGLFEPNLERVCGLLRERRDAMLEALDRELAGRARWNRPEGGYFLWLELVDGADSTELLGPASEAGVTFVPGADFGGPASSLRLAFSFVSPAEIDDGVTRLAAALPVAVELG